MTKPHEILVAVDFGDASARAVALGGALAARCEATLRLLHAEPADVPPYFTAEQLGRIERERQAMRVQAEEYLASFGRQHTSRPFATKIDDRPPVDAILAEAAAADLVVVGTHGRRGPARWWLGSVAERVLREVNRPLLVVRAEAPGSAAIAFSRAIVHAPAPLQGSAAAAYARDIIGCFGGQLVDARGATPAAALAATGASLLVVATPQPAIPGWLAHAAEPLLRSSRVPILFVPESLEGATL